MPCAVPVVVVVAVVIVACYFGIYRVLTQSQFQLTLFAFGHCQCRLPATVGRVDSCLQVGRGKERGKGGNPFPFIRVYVCVCAGIYCCLPYEKCICVLQRHVEQTNSFTVNCPVNAAVSFSEFLTRSMVLCSGV